MRNPIKWKRAHQIAWLISLPMGAIAGLVLGYCLSDWKWGGLDYWITKRTDDAITWALLGTIVVVVAVWGTLAMTSSRGKIGLTRAPPKITTITHPPRPGDMQAANSNGKIAKVS